MSESKQNPISFSVKKLDEFAMQKLAIDYSFRVHFPNTNFLRQKNVIPFRFFGKKIFKIVIF